MGFFSMIGDFFSAMWNKFEPFFESLLTHEVQAAWPIIEEAVTQVAANNPNGGKPLDLLNQAVAIAVPKLEASAIKVGLGQIAATVSAVVTNTPALNKSNGQAA